MLAILNSRKTDGSWGLGRSLWCSFEWGRERPVGSKPVALFQRQRPRHMAEPPRRRGGDLG